MTEAMAQMLQTDNTHLRHEVRRLTEELRKYRPDVSAWRQWIFDIQTEAPARYLSPTGNKVEVIAHGLMRSLYGMLYKWNLANYADRDLVLLVPEEGFDPAAFKGPGDARLMGIRTRTVPGLTWPVLGTELVRPGPPNPIGSRPLGMVGP